MAASFYRRAHRFMSLLMSPSQPQYLQTVQLSLLSNPASSLAPDWQ